MPGASWLRAEQHGESKHQAEAKADAVFLVSVYFMACSSESTLKAIKDTKLTKAADNTRVTINC